MPKEYVYQLANGKELVLEGDTEPTDAEVEAEAAAAGVSLVLADEPAPSPSPLSSPVAGGGAGSQSAESEVTGLPFGALSAVGVPLASHGPEILDQVTRGAGSVLKGVGRIAPMVGGSAGATAGAMGTSAALGTPFPGIVAGAQLGRQATRPVGRGLKALGQGIQDLTVPPAVSTAAGPGGTTLPSSWQQFATPPGKPSPTKSKKAPKAPKKPPVVPSTPATPGPGLMARGATATGRGLLGVAKRLAPGIGTAMTLYDVYDMLNNMDRTTGNINQSIASASAPTEDEGWLRRLLQGGVEPEPQMDPMVRELLEREMSSRSGR